MDDAALKKLFSHPLMIELLIRRHVPEWQGEIEYSSLERLPSELIDERLRRRYPDMIWRARTIDGTTDLVLLLELQGRPERHMVLRTTTYNVLAVQELIEHDKELPIPAMPTTDSGKPIADSRSCRSSWRSGGP